MATRAKTLSTPTKMARLTTPASSPALSGGLDDFKGMTSPDSPFNKSVPGEAAMKRANSYDSQKSPKKKKLTAQKASIKSSEKLIRIIGDEFEVNMPIMSAVGTVDKDGKYHLYAIKFRETKALDSALKEKDMKLGIPSDRAKGMSKFGLKYVGDGERMPEPLQNICIPDQQALWLEPYAW